MFFAGGPGIDRELWKSNGTLNGTVRVADIRPGSAGSEPGGLTDVAGTLFFVADDGSTGRELWQSTGATATLVGDIYPGATGSDPTDLTAVGSTLFFAADDGTHGAELWHSDGTAPGTGLVKDVTPGSAGSTLGWLTAVNGDPLLHRGWRAVDEQWH